MNKKNPVRLRAVAAAAAAGLIVLFSFTGCAWFRSDEAVVTSFSFLADDNPGALVVDAVGVIDESAQTITVTVPVGTDVSDLVASFELEEHQYLNIGIIRQKSGEKANDFSSPVTYTVIDSFFTGRDYTVTVVATDTLTMGTRSGGSFTYSLDFGGTAKDVYFVLTNSSLYDDSDPPTIELDSSRGMTSRGIHASEIDRGSAQGITPMAIPDLPSLRDAEPPALVKAPGWSLKSLFGGGGVSEPLYAAVGEVPDPPLKDEAGAVVASHCRASVTADTAFGTKVLNIWVADDCWTGAGVKSYEVDNTMVELIAGSFLSNASTDDDIYDWVTGIFGEEWGDHSYSNLIGITDTIDIFLYDIEGDDISDTENDGWVVGFFDSTNNYKVSSLPASNERIMFFMDAVLLAWPDTVPAEWAETDYWPQTVVSTLAHEFQHMIHFYQKEVIEGGDMTDVWVNEMCSLMAEEFVADRMGVPGPRGVDPPSDYSAGTFPISDGRLPMFNYFDDEAVNYWNSDLTSYSIAYAFGAYLARNFGGAPLFREIVQSSYGDHEAVVKAVEAQGYDLAFADLLQRWGAAVILSDVVSADEGMIYNTGGAFESTIGGYDYKLGSINLHNYRYYYTYQGNEYYSDGPWFWTSDDGGDVGYGYASSNGYYLEEGISSGTWTFTIPDGAEYGITLIITDP